MEDVLQLKRQLLKASDSPVSALVDVLDRLKEIQASQTLLAKTEIGLVVGKLRKHDDPSVVAKAKSIIKKWKTDVEKEQQELAEKHKKQQTKKETGQESTMQRPSKVDVTTAQPTPSSPAAVEEDDSPVIVDMNDIRLLNEPKSRSVKTDGVDVPTTRDKVRDKCVEMIYSALASNTNAPHLHVVKRALEIESAAFGLLARNNPQTEAYREKIRSLFLNFRDAANPMLRVHVLTGAIDARNLCTMTAEELKSKERLAEDRKLQEANLFAARGAAPQEAETDQFKCGKCKKRKCRYYQMQTRSADEPMTTFVTCVNCGNKWKFC